MSLVIDAIFIYNKASNVNDFRRNGMCSYNISTDSKECYVRAGNLVEAAISQYNSTAQKAVSFRANAVRSENFMQC
jgi:hypothetical protein